MTRAIISTAKAPVASSLFSQAILESSKYRLEISGQIGLDPIVSTLVEGGIEAQLEQTLKNIEAILSEIGWTLENIIKVRIYLINKTDYTMVNKLYGTKFTKNPPARTTVTVSALPLEALIEIECTAVGDEVKRYNAGTAD
jgi:2-iminobutanoate/2-iminopropanoate deaminase